MNNEKRSIYPPSRPSPNTAPSENKVSFMACSHFKCKINIKRFERKLKVTTTMEIEITLDRKKTSIPKPPSPSKTIDQKFTTIVSIFDNNVFLCLCRSNCRTSARRAHTAHTYVYLPRVPLPMPAWNLFKFFISLQKYTFSVFLLSFLWCM